MKHIRILLNGMPQMLRTIIKGIVATDPQCEIVAEIAEQSDVRAQLDQTPADVIILAATASDEKPDRFATLLVQHPVTHIIAIASGGNRAALYDLRPHVTQIDELSPEVLLAAIRQSPGSPPGGV